MHLVASNVLWLVVAFTLCGSMMRQVAGARPTAVDLLASVKLAFPLQGDQDTYNFTAADLVKQAAVAVVTTEEKLPFTTNVLIVLKEVLKEKSCKFYHIEGDAQQTKLMVKILDKAKDKDTEIAAKTEAITAIFTAIQAKLLGRSEAHCISLLIRSVSTAEIVELAGADTELKTAVLTADNIKLFLKYDGGAVDRVIDSKLDELFALKLTDKETPPVPPHAIGLAILKNLNVFELLKLQEDAKAITTSITTFFETITASFTSKELANMPDSIDAAAIIENNLRAAVANADLSSRVLSGQIEKLTSEKQALTKENSALKAVVHFWKYLIGGILGFIVALIIVVGIKICTNGSKSDEDDDEEEEEGDEEEDEKEAVKPKQKAVEV